MKSNWQTSKFIVQLSEFSPYVLAFQIVGLLGLFVKFVQMNLTSGYLLISRYTGKFAKSELTISDKLAFYREDLVVNLIVLPFILLLVIFALNQRYRKVVTFVLCILLGTFYFLGIQGLGNVGRYLNFAMFTDVVSWGIDNPDSVRDYIDVSGALKLVGIFSTCGVIIWLATRSNLLRLAMTMSAILAATGAIVVFVVSHNPAFAKFPQSRSVLEAMSVALFSTTDLSISLRDTAVEEIPSKYAMLVGADNGARDQSRFHGTAKTSDVIIFVMETAPARIMTIANRKGGMPNLNRLVKQSFVSSKHHTTYPYTSDAVFSILSSLYPTSRRRYLKRSHEITQFGLIADLTDNGYRSVVYVPGVTTFEDDKLMFELLGAEEQFLAKDTPFKEEAVARRVQQILDEIPKDSPANSPAARKFAAKKLLDDMMALEKLKSDIATFRQSDQRFVAVFLPTIGHGPWINFHGHRRVVDAGAEIVSLQDRWLGEIIDVLESNGGVDRTLILITADHGVRTRTEDPDFRAGMISDYSFNVPLILYAPRTLDVTEQINHVTSHIDIMPTILDLLGLVSAGPPMQGTTMWDESLPRRVTYFLARGYLGADGYYDYPNYYMYEELTGAAYKNSDLVFQIDNILHGESQEDVRRRVDTLYAISEQWIHLVPASGVVSNQEN